MTFTTITDAAAYIESTVPGHDLGDDTIRELFHATGIAYGEWVERDDARLADFADAVERAALVDA